MLDGVRSPVVATVAGLFGCVACHGPAADPGPPVSVVEALPAGTAVAVETTNAPDEPVWRAAAVWWREAIRQSPAWLLLDGEGAAAATVRLRLVVDPAAKSLTAVLVHADRERTLGTVTVVGNDVPAAIDRLAQTARRAAGESTAPAVPVAACVSADPRVAIAVDDAAAMLRDGGTNAAWTALLLARQRDGASPAVLDGIAAIELLRGEARKAERTCLEALAYENRLAPTTRHRLARTLLLARASLHPDRANDHDRELLALARAGRDERPFDLQVRLGEALAANFLGDFATARPILEDLRARLPDQPIVAYHLGWACLGTGDAEAAIAPFDAAAVRLPAPWTIVPRAIARFAANRLDDLGTLLGTLQDDLRNDGDPLVHELLRMRAAHALLTDRIDVARDCIERDLQWLAHHPEQLERRAGELAEGAAVLVRLGGGDRLATTLAELQKGNPATAVADACAFAAGLTTIARTRERAEDLETRLARGGQSAWGALLEAFACEVRGEVAAMQDALSRAARLDDSPMTKALLARSLRAAGRVDESETLLRTLRAELTTIRLRRSPRHPILGPELAFAYRGGVGR